MRRQQTLEVLWLEDERTFVDATRDLFRHEGTAAHDALPWHARIHHVTTLQEAEAALAGAVPDIIITSLHVPDGHGHEVLGALRRAMPEGAIVVLSAAQEVEVGFTAAIYDAEFLHKDHLTREALWRTMALALGRQAARSAAPVPRATSPARSA